MTVVPTKTLPKEFADLEPYADWCIPDEGERYAKRLATPQSQLQAFYDAVFPRAKAAMEHCNQFPLDSMPDDAVNLMHLLYALITVSFSVECWSQPRVPDSGATYLDCVVAPGP